MIMAHDWHLGILPTVIREVRHGPGLAPLRSLPRPLLILAPQRDFKQVSESFVSPLAKVAVVRGIKNPTLPTLNPVKIARIADALSEFTRQGYAAAEVFLRMRSMY